MFSCGTYYFVRMNVLAECIAGRIDLRALPGQNKASCFLDYMCKHCYLSFYLPNPQMPFEITFIYTMLNSFLKHR